MFANNTKETAELFGKTLKSLENAKNLLFSNLTEEQLKEIAIESADFTKVINAAKSGNVEELNKYVSKYANIH
tara:strand:+ start:1246 stop:1464 length:219 start_codon:yes stop_codon:yes gene_type:complete